MQNNCTSKYNYLSVKGFEIIKKTHVLKKVKSRLIQDFGIIFRYNKVLMFN